MVGLEGRGHSSFYPEFIFYLHGQILIFIQIFTIMSHSVSNSNEPDLLIKGHTNILEEESSCL